MNTSESFEALRRANPRLKAGFPAALEAAADAVRDRLDTGAADGPVGVVHARHHLPRLSAASASLAVVAVAAALTLFGSPGGGQGVDSAVAAVKAAATVTAASAERSGTASVRISHNGELWAGSTVRWHDQDLSVTSDAPRRPGRAGSKLLLVDGTLYGIDPRDGDWVALGSPKSIDPGSGDSRGVPRRGA